MDFEVVVCGLCGGGAFTSFGHIICQCLDFQDVVAFYLTSI